MLAVARSDYILGPEETVDNEVDRAVENEAEVLNGGEAEHPAGVGGKQSGSKAQVRPHRHTRLYSVLYITVLNTGITCHRSCIIQCLGDFK